MNLFRSGEHVTRWLGARAPGYTMPVAVLGELALAWWSDRLAPTWRPRSRDANQAILANVGLTGPFWELP